MEFEPNRTKHLPRVTVCRLSGAGVLGLIGVVANTRRRLLLKPHPDSGVKMLLSDGLTLSLIHI